MAVKVYKKIQVVKSIDVPDLGEKINQAQKQSGKTVTQVCKDVDISRTFWYQVINEKVPEMSEATLRKIEEVLGVDLGVKMEDDRP